MNTYADKTQENKSQAVANSLPKLKSNGESTFQFVDNRPEATAQRKLQEVINNSSRVQQLRAHQEMANNSPHVKQLRVHQAMADNCTSQTAQRKENLEEEILQGKFEPIQKKGNKTGLPDNLKAGIENLSGHSMDDVKVHYNSDKPAQLNAHAYAQGTDIHIASGQEKHLPHEAWHVVQQKQGRVKPTMQMKGKVNVNDDAGLEKEADIMGNKSINMIPSNTTKKNELKNSSTPQLSGPPTHQMIFRIENAHETQKEFSYREVLSYLQTYYPNTINSASLAKLRELNLSNPIFSDWAGLIRKVATNESQSIPLMLTNLPWRDMEKLGATTANKQSPKLFLNRFPKDYARGKDQYQEDELIQTRFQKATNLKYQGKNIKLGKKYDYVVFPDYSVRVSQDLGHIDIAFNRPVIAAGAFKLYSSLDPESGQFVNRVIYIDNSSGHYLNDGPNPKVAAVIAFKNLGLHFHRDEQTSDYGRYVEKEWTGNKATGKAKPWQGWHPKKK